MKRPPFTEAEIALLRARAQLDQEHARMEERGRDVAEEIRKGWQEVVRLFQEMHRRGDL